MYQQAALDTVTLEHGWIVTLESNCPLDATCYMLKCDMFKCYMFNVICLMLRVKMLHVKMLHVHMLDSMLNLCGEGFIYI